MRFIFIPDDLSLPDIYHRCLKVPCAGRGQVAGSGFAGSGKDRIAVMKTDINEIYKELKNGIDRKRLMDISVEIICKYREKDYNTLMWYASLLGIDALNTNINRLFSRVIQNYHPDKFEKIVSDINRHYENNNIDELVRIKRIYLHTRKTKSDYLRNNLYQEIMAFFDRKSDVYNERDLFHDEVILDASYDEISDDFFTDDEYGFMDAVNNHYFGNLYRAIGRRDLKGLEGELDLSGYDITDLRGVENCVNISGLNLSGNRIYKIELLSYLSRLEALYIAENNIDGVESLADMQCLKELDISFNEIEDISALRGLGSLEYLNITGNPIADRTVIDELSGRGVIVIF